MALDLSMCRFSGPALPEPFVRFELEKELKELLPKTTGDAGRELGEAWTVYRRHLRELVSQGGPIRVRNAVIEPLLARLGYDSIEDAGEIATREGREAGGWLLRGPNGTLRAWTTSLGDDLDAPTRRGHAYRFSHLRIAQRVLLATNERIGLLTNGVDLRILISDPARADSQIEIPVESTWKSSRDVPDSFRLLLALCSPKGVKVLPDLVEKARLKQTGVTKELRKQARQAVELFVQALLDNPSNHAVLAEYGDKEQLSKQLWHEGLVNIFRLLFILKMEAVGDPARVFSFASTSLWRNTFSPSVALAKIVRDVLDRGAQTGRFLEDGLRALYRMFTDGLTATEINVKPLGGALFGPDATPLISKLHWGEQAVAHLLDRLLWTPKQRGTNARERVHYGPLTVQDLGRVYESLIELESGITTEPMCRLRRSKLEVVVPVEQGAKYRKSFTAENAEDAEEEDESDESEEESKGKKTKIEWIEEIPKGRFFLRVGLGRKASGSYYTPDSFVKFLVQETLGPLCAERSPKDNPQPLAILNLKVADIAMGSGHFLFEACDFLADRLYEACRQCDELAMKAEAEAEKLPQSEIEARRSKLQRAADYRSRVQALPDPNDELMAYLPSRAPEDGLVGFSTAKALALCKRLVAVHCLYGVDLNPLAVELAKLSLWIETHAEGLPLTFLDHRFVVGNSLTGPFFDHLLKYPGSQQSMDDLFTQGLKEKFTDTLQAAMREVHDLESTVGINLGEIEAKKAAKRRMDDLLDPFKLVARAWSGGVMLGRDGCDDSAYAALVKAVAEGGDGGEVVERAPTLGKMVATGFQALEFDLAFPDVFFRTGDINERSGFDVVLGNPPWDTITIKSKEWLARYEMDILSASSRETQLLEERILADAAVRLRFDDYVEGFEQSKRSNDRLYQYQKVEVHGDLAGRFLDLFRVFMERNASLLSSDGFTGVVVPSAFHANEGATGVRRLYLEQMAIRCCYSFENARRLFDIHRSFKFALIIAGTGSRTTQFPCAFYLHDDTWLFATDKAPEQLLYSADFVRAIDPACLSFLELTNANDKAVYEVAATGPSFRDWRLQAHGEFSTSEMNLTKDAWRLQQAPATYSRLQADDRLSLCRQMRTFPLFEGKGIHQYEPFYAKELRYSVKWSCLEDRKYWFTAAGFYRLAYRKIARSTDERCMIFSLLPPLAVTAESCPSERVPLLRSNFSALSLLAVCNSYSADFLLGRRLTATVNLFILDSTPLPDITLSRHFLSHSALRLTAVDSQFVPLWTEQLGDVWREPKAKHAWPVLEGDDERWAVRAAIDAVVAEAYGLTREQYAHVLSTFSHKSYPKAPELCLACFNELKKIGLDAFTKKHDPYWDIPLNENLPKPVIDLPEIHHGNAEGAENTKSGKGRGRKKIAVVRERPAQYTLDFGDKG